MSRQSSYPRTGLLGWMSVLKWEGMREVDRRNEKRVNLYALLWAIGLIAVTALVQFGQLSQGWAWMLAAIPVLFGLVCMRAYLRLLRQMDELLRQMQFEAMAIGFGTGMIVGMALIVVAIPYAWVAPAILVPMTIGYCARIILGARELARNSADAEGGE